MAGTTSATSTARPRRVARLVQAAIVLAVLLAAGTRAFAAPVGPIDVSGAPASASGAVVAAAEVAYGIGSDGRVHHVTVTRPAGAGADQPVTLVVADAAGSPLATASATLQGPTTVVPLPAPVDPALVGRVSLSA